MHRNVIFFAGIVCALAVSFSSSVLNFDNEQNISPTVAARVFAGECYRHGNLSKKYCSFWCGYTAVKHVVIEPAPGAGNKVEQTPCNNVATCQYKLDQLIE